MALIQALIRASTQVLSQVLSQAGMEKHLGETDYLLRLGHVEGTFEA